MGQRAMKKPKFSHGYIDRHGKPRFYFRRSGFKNAPLPGLPWSPEFMAAYEAAMAGQSPQEIAASRAGHPGTVRALAISFFNSAPFRALKADSTQAAYRNIIDRLCLEHGDKRVATMQREHVIAMMAARADKPDSANGLRKVLRAMMQHAIEIGLRKDDPTRDVKALRVKTDGYHSWTEDEISQFENRHAIGTRPRLALALLLYTGQRRSDVVRMGRQHVSNGFISVRQIKTGAALEIQIHSTLAAVIAATPSEHLTYLTTQFGKPFTAAGFGNWFRDQCTAAGLPQCSAHGLRKACARRLAEAGCTPHEIAAITGHTSLREVQRYTKAVDQRRLGIAAMNKMRTVTG
jgi:integrase